MKRYVLELERPGCEPELIEWTDTQEEAIDLANARWEPGDSFTIYDTTTTRTVWVCDHGVARMHPAVKHDSAPP